MSTVSEMHHRVPAIDGLDADPVAAIVLEAWCSQATEQLKCGREMLEVGGVDDKGNNVMELQIPLNPGIKQAIARLRENEVQELARKHPKPNCQLVGQLRLNGTPAAGSVLLRLRLTESNSNRPQDEDSRGSQCWDGDWKLFCELDCYVDLHRVEYQMQSSPGCA